MKVIVSANYLDRNSDHKYLVRRESDPVEAAVPYMRVVIRNGEVKSSSAIEEGFGCRRVIVAEEEDVVGYKSAKFNSLRFDGYNFRDSRGREVTEAKVFILSDRVECVK